MSRLTHLLALLTVLLLAACGGGGGGGEGGGSAGATPASIVASAITATKDTESYRLTADVKSDLGPKKEHVEMSLEGVSSADSYRGRFEGVYTQGTDKPFPMEFIMVGNEAWVRSKQLDEVLPKGKKWLHVPEDGAPTRTMTPSEFLDFLKDSPKIEEVGREPIRGNPSVHLRGPVDIKKLAEATSSEAAQAIARVPAAGRMKLFIDVWVSERDDRLTRMALDISTPDAPGNMRISSDVLEWDVPLDAEKPPKATVVEEKDLG